MVKHILKHILPFGLGLVAFALVALLLLGGCAPQGQTAARPVSSPLQGQTGCGVEWDSQKAALALYGAENAYSVAAGAYLSTQTLLPADIRAQVRARLVQAYEALKLARLAHAAADPCALQSRLQSAGAFVTESLKVMGKVKQ